jgi:ABC-type transport system involved in cytochrome c biogenesis ATPase subunit
MAAHNLLSFADAELEFDPALTVLVGPNGAGKSNVVRLLAVAGLALDWLEDRYGGRSYPGGVEAARRALATYAAARHRGSARRPKSKLEVGLELSPAELDDLTCFVRAAIVSSVLVQQSQIAQELAAWADDQVTSRALNPLARGVLVLEHEGSTDAPWDVSYEFAVDDVVYRWVLASRLAAPLVIAPVENGPLSSSTGGRYEPMPRVLLGRAAEQPHSSELPELPPFSLGLLCRNGSVPVEAPQVQPPGGNADPELAPLRHFAELADIPLWTQPRSRVYSLAWLLRLVVQRGLVMISEQLRGVATMTAPLRPVGVYSIDEMSAQLPSNEPYALPLRLLRLKTGSLAERQRFEQVCQLFTNLAPGRGVDLSLAVTKPGRPAEEGGAESDPQTVVTIQVLHQNPAGESWELPIQVCGAGTWEALVLAEALADADGKVVVLDEPAANLHPGWQKLLRTQISQRAGTAQFVLITHSPYLLAMDSEQDLRRLVRAAPHDGTTRLARITQPITDQRAVLRDYSMSADARAMLFASGAVLLEGETELGALPLWFAKSQTAKELGDPDSRHLAFYNVGGDTHFKAPLTLLNAIGVAWVIICGGWLFDPHFRGNHIFRQVAAAGAASAGLKAFIDTYINDQATAATVTFEQATQEGAKYGIFTLARGWTRDTGEATGDESFEYFIEGLLPGQLAKAESEVGKGKSLRKGRWLAENNPCPSQVNLLYRHLVDSLDAQ